MFIKSNKAFSLSKPYIPCWEGSYTLSTERVTRRKCRRTRAKCCATFFEKIGRIKCHPRLNEGWLLVFERYI